MRAELWLPAAASGSTIRPMAWLGRLVAAAFFVAVLSQLQGEVLIAWFGPWLTLVPALVLFGRWIGSPVAFALGVYGFSIVGGIVAMEAFGMSNGASARLAGWVLPPALVVAYGVLAAVRAVLRRWLPERIVAELDAGAHRLAWAVGGMTLGALVGAFAGVGLYYLTDVGTVLYVAIPAGGDQLLVTAATIFGALTGILLGPRALEPAPQEASPSPPP